MTFQRGNVSALPTRDCCLRLKLCGTAEAYLWAIFASALFSCSQVIECRPVPDDDDWLEGRKVRTSTTLRIMSCLRHPQKRHDFVAAVQSGDTEWLQVPANYVERMDDEGESEVAAAPVTAPPAASEQVECKR